MNILDKAMSMLGAVNSQAAQKAKSEYSKYSPDINGLKQAVSDWGGNAMIDKACDFVKMHPKVAGALRMANIDPERIKRQLQNTPENNPAAIKSNVQNASTSSYKDRLSRLK